MSTEPVRLERRVGQRFEVHLPISIRAGGLTVPGFTQDVSARGVFLYAEALLPETSEVELTFTMPSEITLGENMRVRCRGRVLRCHASGTGQRNGIAVRLRSYEYLPEHDAPPELARVSPQDSLPERLGAIPR